MKHKILFGIKCTKWPLEGCWARKPGPFRALKANEFFNQFICHVESCKVSLNLASKGRSLKLANFVVFVEAFWDDTFCYDIVVLTQPTNLFQTVLD